MGSAGGKFLDRVLCVLGAVAVSQLPEFMQQYAQRLGGHLAEAQRQLALFDEVAAKSGLTLNELIAKTSANAEKAVAGLGGVMEATVARVDQLTAADTALRDANVFSRPFVFFRYIETDIARATWGAFKPAVPTTLEGLVYAAVGVLVALVVYHALIALPVRGYVRHRRARNRRRVEEQEQTPATAGAGMDGRV